MSESSWVEKSGFLELKKFEGNSKNIKEYKRKLRENLQSHFKVIDFLNIIYWSICNFFLYMWHYSITRLI